MKTTLQLCFTLLFLTTSMAFGQWTQQGTDIDGEAAGDNSGYSISLSEDGSRLAIGAHQNDGNGVGSGHVRVYDYDGASWSQAGADIDGEAANDFSGRSVSLSSDGSRLAIGAYGNDGNGVGSGHVRVYEYDGAGWNQLGADIDGEAANDFSGSSVSLSGDGSRLAIGANQNDGNGANSGHVRVYEYDGAGWNQLGADIDGEAADDFSGSSVSLSDDGSRLAIGALNNDGNGASSGHIRVYNYDGVSWNQLGADIDGEAANDQFGWSVSLSGDGSRLAVGANLNDGNGGDSGHVRIYEYDGAGWNQLGADIDGEAAGDYSGISVSLSSDGNRAAVGAYRNDGNGADCGHVRVYEYDGANWNQSGTDIDGEAANDQFGWSVSLSGDGSTLAIGAYHNGGNGASSGHVRVYSNPVLSAPLTDDPGIALSLYPNPAGAVLHIGLSSGTDLAAVRIYNLKGERLAAAKSTTIPVAHLAEGVYLAEIELSDKRTLVKKIIVSRD